MKNNKITRKILKLEIINDVVEDLNSRLENYNASIERRNEQHRNRIEELTEAHPDDLDYYLQSDWDLKMYVEDIEKTTIQADECKKIIAELEKMA